MIPKERDVYRKVLAARTAILRTVLSQATQL